MNYSFFENAINNGIIQTPNDYFRDQQQAAIDQQWEYTSARYTIEEQVDFGSYDFRKIEVWVDNVVGLSSRGFTNGQDFKRLLFRNINHQVKRGLYYKFDDNYWICYFTDSYAAVNEDIGVRRCNNVLKIVDPENGKIFVVPCVVDYDMTSPNVQVSSYVITPNNHATVIVQGNKDTLRLFKINTRYILGGRPFKLLAYQNTIIDKSISNEPTLLYLDLYLDELQAKDDIENQLAYNGTFNYTLKINSNNMELVKNDKGVLEAQILLNGEEVERDIIWYSTNWRIVNINKKGEYTVLGSSGECQIIGYLKGNKKVYDSINIKVVDKENVTPKLIIQPAFSQIRQFESIQFKIEVNYGSEIINNLSMLSLSLTENEIVLFNDYIDIEQNDNYMFTITGKKISNNLQFIYIKIQNDNPNFTFDEVLSLDVISMMG